MTASAAPGSRRLPDVARPRSRPLTVAIVNNMPDTALAATERQFRGMLTANAGGSPLAIRVFVFPKTLRGPAGAAYCAAHYEPIEALFDADVDALIVSGCEPGNRPLPEEPFWPAFARLVDWARDNTVSTIWSCLAAHAAVLHLDGIARQRMPQKLSGVFACGAQAGHPLLAAAPDPLLVPHSRHNTLDDRVLADRGYAVLTRSDATGADLFVKAMPSLFVFLQGHPEYDGDSLQREFRRDVGRFLAGTMDRFPGVPAGLFDAPLVAALAAFAEVARAKRSLDVLPMLPSLDATGAAPWAASTAALYRNWLAIVAERRAELRQGAG